MNKLNCLDLIFYNIFCNSLYIMYKINSKNIIKSINLDNNILDLIIKSKFKFYYGSKFNKQFIPSNIKVTLKNIKDFLQITKDSLKNINTYYKLISALYILNIPILYKQYSIDNFIINNITLITIFNNFNFYYIINDSKKILVNNSKNTKIYFYILESKGILYVRYYTKIIPDYHMDSADYLIYLKNKDDLIINNSFIIDYLEYLEYDSNKIKIIDYIDYYRNKDKISLADYSNYLLVKNGISIDNYLLYLKINKIKPIRFKIFKKFIDTKPDLSKSVDNIIVKLNEYILNN